MESSSIELPGSEISAVGYRGGCLYIRFSRAYIIRTMTSSQERTRWWQRGDLVMEGAKIEARPPEGQLVCDGGDIDDNIFIYRDMIPIPLDTWGLIRCDLCFRGTDIHLVASGETLKLEMVDVPKYIEHVRSEG